jgi:hypothetical protein
MGTIELPPDLSEFLRLLHSHAVEYLLVGGHAVGYYGHPRATNDMDIWVRPTAENAAKLVRVFIDFGYSPNSIRPEIFLDRDKVIRIGVPPVCIDVIMAVSGVDFSSCYPRRNSQSISGVPATLISLEDLKANKQASGRLKDLDDLENLN